MGRRSSISDLDRRFALGAKRQRQLSDQETRRIQESTVQECSVCGEFRNSCKSIPIGRGKRALICGPCRYDHAMKAKEETGARMRRGVINSIISTLQKKGDHLLVLAILEHAGVLEYSLDVLLGFDEQANAATGDPNQIIVDKVWQYLRKEGRLSDDYASEYDPPEKKKEKTR